MSAKKKNLGEAYDEIAARERERVNRQTGGNKDSLAKFDRMANAGRGRTVAAVAGKRPDDYAGIVDGEKNRRRSAVRTGGQW